MNCRLTEDQVKRLELAWRCILGQYREHSKKNATEEGPGINIYRMLPATNNKGSNCEYYYAGYQTEVWTLIVGQNSYLEEIYQPGNTYAICVQIPAGEDDYNDTIGNCRVFDSNNDKEIMNDPPEKDHQPLEDKKGVHQRRPTSLED